MRKSQSCPSLPGLACPASPIPGLPRAKVSAAALMPMHIDLLAAPETGVEDIYVPSPSAERDVLGLIVAKAPALQAGICMMENPHGVEDAFRGHDTGDARGLAACMLSPNESEECQRAWVLENARKGIYLATDPNRAGEIMVRVRKARRVLGPA